MKTRCRWTASFFLALAAALAVAPASAQQQSNPERDAYFGETHIHTAWSFDAYVFGNTVTGPGMPTSSRLVRTIKHPAGYDIKITRPLDFMAVTDHSEYAGTVRLANDPNSDISKLPIADKLKVRSKEDIMKVYLFLGNSIMEKKPLTELTTPAVAGSVWKQVVATADKYYQPGKFTTFAAYEWSSTPDNRNMHRNIIFLNSKKVPEYHSIRSTRTILRTCGTGWIRSAKQAMSCWQSRITPT